MLLSFTWSNIDGISNITETMNVTHSCDYLRGQIHFLAVRATVPLLLSFILLV